MEGCLAKTKRTPYGKGHPYFICLIPHPHHILKYIPPPLDGQVPNVGIQCIMNLRSHMRTSFLYLWPLVMCKGAHKRGGGTRARAPLRRETAGGRLDEGPHPNA